MAEHTPTPWSCSYKNDRRQIIINNIYSYDHSPSTGGTGAYNAAMIVRAVNSHAALVEALRNVLEAAEGAHLTVGDCNQARAALALA